MRTAAVICQIVIALGIVNVWVLRPGRPTRWRPEGAQNMKEEFAKYGLPDWMRKLVGAAKLLLARFGIREDRRLAGGVFLQARRAE